MIWLSYLLVVAVNIIYIWKYLLPPINLISKLILELSPQFIKSSPHGKLISQIFRFRSLSFPRLCTVYAVSITMTTIQAESHSHLNLKKTKSKKFRLYSLNKSRTFRPIRQQASSLWLILFEGFLLKLKGQNRTGSEELCMLCLWMTVNN